mmetsp:Transcript_68359/g.79592  ORF Transcript_68359/g.79592 Transcript_68359/m.79592 type:complete len:219 (-) Transcript_68359:210-866(-)
MLALASLLVGLAGTLEHLLDWSHVKTLVLWKTDPWVLALTNDEDVADSGSEVGSSGISEMDDIEATEMSLTVGDDTDSSDVVSLGDQSNVTSVELGEVEDGVSGDVELDGVVDRDFWVSESDGSSVVSNDVWDFVWSDFLSDDLAEFVFSFIRLDGSHDESSLNVEEHSEVFTGLVDGDDVHKTSWVSGVSSDFAVNLDTTFVVVNDNLGLSVRQGVF